jgi:hypothetical protein
LPTQPQVQCYCDMPFALAALLRCVLWLAAAWGHSSGLLKPKARPAPFGLDAPWCQRPEVNSDSIVRRTRLPPSCATAAQLRQQQTWPAQDSNLGSASDRQASAAGATWPARLRQSAQSWPGAERISTERPPAAGFSVSEFARGDIFATPRFRKLRPALASPARGGRGSPPRKKTQQRPAPSVAPPMLR